MLNHFEKPELKILPDVASGQTETALQGRLQWVGMKAIELPLVLRDSKNQLYRVPAHCDAFVSLDNATARGIHMSRLYKITQEVLAQNELSYAVIHQVLSDILKNHEGLSENAKIALQFAALVERKALVSDNFAWRSYPVEISAALSRSGQIQCYLEVLVTYSSTCPASAALSRQLIQEQFKEQFAEALIESGEIYSWLGSPQGIVATPHAQRSTARVKVQVKPDGAGFHFTQLIDLIEQSLQTPVQTTVKREDEQEFALRSGQNLMFCEDAARRVRAALLAEAEILDFAGEFRHIESLHPHDAVSYIERSGRLKL